MRARLVWLHVLLLLLCVAGLPQALAQEPPCATVTIGLEPSQAGNSGGAVLGDSPGQTFVAADTLMRSLTVWRVASQATNGIGMRLYITETDSTGFPELRRIVQNGPTIVHTDGDGVNPTPFHWAFDPPLALPKPGVYAFFLAQDPCLAHFDILTTAKGPGLYNGGNAWGSARGCYLTGYPYAANGDLIFQIEFCSDEVSKTASSSWGKLKLIYR